jgi:hypothetical protein
MQEAKAFSESLSAIEPYHTLGARQPYQPLSSSQCNVVGCTQPSLTGYGPAHGLCMIHSQQSFPFKVVPRSPGLRRTRVLSTIPSPPTSPNPNGSGLPTQPSINMRPFTSDGSSFTTSSQTTHAHRVSRTVAGVSRSGIRPVSPLSPSSPMSTGLVTTTTSSSSIPSSNSYLASTSPFFLHRGTVHAQSAAVVTHTRPPAPPISLPPEPSPLLPGGVSLVAPRRSSTSTSSNQKQQSIHTTGAALSTQPGQLVPVVPVPVPTSTPPRSLAPIPSTKSLNVATRALVTAVTASSSSQPQNGTASSSSTSTTIATSKKRPSQLVIAIPNMSPLSLPSPPVATSPSTSPPPGHGSMSSSRSPRDIIKG